MRTHQRERREHDKGGKLRRSQFTQQYCPPYDVCLLGVRTDVLDDERQVGRVEVDHPGGNRASGVDVEQSNQLGLTRGSILEDMSAHQEALGLHVLSRVYLELVIMDGPRHQLRREDES